MSEETYEVAAPTPAMPQLRVAILGTGKMGGILLQAFLKNNLLGPDQIFATVHHPERAQALSVQYGIEMTTDNLAAASQADVILLGVKPVQVPALVEQITACALAGKTGAFDRGFGEDAQHRGCRGLRSGGDSRDAQYAGHAGGWHHGALRRDDSSRSSRWRLRSESSRR